MKLTYRGSQYEIATSTISTVSGNVIGKYRGFTLKTQRHIDVPLQSLSLLYRGAYYRAAVDHGESIGLSNAL